MSVTAKGHTNGAGTPHQHRQASKLAAALKAGFEAGQATSALACVNGHGDRQGAIVGASRTEKRPAHDAPILPARVPARAKQRRENFWRAAYDGIRKRGTRARGYLVAHGHLTAASVFTYLIAGSVMAEMLFAFVSHAVTG